MAVVGVAIAGAAIGHLVEHGSAIAASSPAKRFIVIGCLAFALGFLAALLVTTVLFTHLANGAIILGLATGYVSAAVAKAAFRRDERVTRRPATDPTGRIDPSVIGCCTTLLGAVAALTL